MNTRDMNFLAQALEADRYMYHMLYDSCMIEVSEHKAGSGKSHQMQLSKSEGDDLIFKTTPKITI
jgi:hypothetical protein